MASNYYMTDYWDEQETHEMQSEWEDRLMSENAKLRKLNSFDRLRKAMGCNIVRDDHNGGIIYQRVHLDKALFDQLCDDVEAEITKLQELVRDMYACISHANEQDWFYFERDKLGCGMCCTVNGEGCGLLALADRMRELGVEVDDG